MKNTIAESNVTGLIVQVENMYDNYFNGRVLVGDFHNEVGDYVSLGSSNFNISNNEPKPIESKEEFDMTTNEGRLAYAKKHYPIGTVIKSIHNHIEFELTSEPRNYMKTTIAADSHGRSTDIYHCGDWAKIIIKEVFNISNNEPKEDKIVTQIVDKFKKRSEIGIKKYNTTLAENNTDDFIEHLSEELMDSLLYLQKIKEQKDTYFQLLGRYNELKEQFEKLQAKIKELC